MGNININNVDDSNVNVAGGDINHTTNNTSYDTNALLMICATVVALILSVWWIFRKSLRSGEYGLTVDERQCQASSTSTDHPTSDVTTDSIEAIDGEMSSRTSGISKGRRADDIPDGSVIDDDDKMQTQTYVFVSNSDPKLSSIPDEQNSPHQSRSDQSAISSSAARKPSMEETETESHGQTIWKLYHKFEEFPLKLSAEQMYHLLRSFGLHRNVDDFIRHQIPTKEIVARGFAALIDLGSETFNLQTIYDYFNKQDLKLFSEQIEEFCEKNGFELTKAENAQSENKVDELVEQTTVKETQMSDCNQTYGQTVPPLL